jgi:hypothetical protein
MSAAINHRLSALRRRIATNLPKSSIGSGAVIWQ